MAGGDEGEGEEIWDHPRSAPLSQETVSQWNVRRERQSGSKALERGLLGMGKHRWLKIVCLHMVGGPESKRLKVAALNLFHPTASPLFRKAVLSYCDTPPEGEGMFLKGV